MLSLRIYAVLNWLLFGDVVPRRQESGSLSDQRQHGSQVIDLLGWVEGVEPSTSRATVWRSATELYPPHWLELPFYTIQAVTHRPARVFAVMRTERLQERIVPIHISYFPAGRWLG
jgi:hypothetical protein